MLKNYIESFSYGQMISRDEKIEIGRKELFDFYYPFYDELERAGFETRFIKHFYMRDIGTEVMGLFKFRLEDYLNLNMSYWNDMFLTEKMEFPVFEDFDYMVGEIETKTTDNQNKTDVLKDGTMNQDSIVDEKNSGLSNDNATTTKNNRFGNTTRTNATEDGFNRNIFSDTPQSDLQITVNDGSGFISHATSLEEDKNKKISFNDSATSGSEDENNTITKAKTDSELKNKVSGVDIVDHEKKTIDTDKKEQQAKNNDKVYKGKKGDTDYADMLKKYRSTLLRIEKQIFREVNKEGIFLLVYGGR